MSVKISFRQAQINDLPNILALLIDDDLGKHRENPSCIKLYEKAMTDIQRDPNNTIWIADVSGKIAGILQLTFIANLTLQGGLRAQVEGVRIERSFRGKGIVSALINNVIQLAKNRGCRLIQLTSNATRLEALKFYEIMGFEKTHVGLKLNLIRPEELSDA